MMSDLGPQIGRYRRRSGRQARAATAASDAIDPFPTCKPHIAHLSTGVPAPKPDLVIAICSCIIT